MSRGGGTFFEKGLGAVGGAIGLIGDTITGGNGGGLFAPPPKPKLPGVVPPPAVPDSSGAPPSAEELARRARQVRGTGNASTRSGTLITGPLGITNQGLQVRNKTLLGL